MQVTTSLAMGYSVRMPDLFRQFAGILGLANLDAFQLVPLECFMEHCAMGGHGRTLTLPCHARTLTLPCHGLPRRICSPR